MPATRKPTQPAKPPKWSLALTGWRDLPMATFVPFGLPDHYAVRTQRGSVAGFVSEVYRDTGLTLWSVRNLRSQPCGFVARIHDARSLSVEATPAYLASVPRTRFLAHGAPTRVFQDGQLWVYRLPRGPGHSYLLIPRIPKARRDPDDVENGGEEEHDTMDDD